MSIIRFHRKKIFHALLLTAKRIIKFVLPLKLIVALRTFKNSLLDKHKYGRKADVFFLDRERIELISNNGIIDLRQGTNHPCSLLYSSKKCREALLTGKIADGRTGPFTLKGKSPLFSAANGAVQHGIEKEDVIGIMEKILIEYHDKNKRKSAAEWLGLSPDHRLSQLPKWGAVFPWTARTPEARLQAIGEERELNNKRLEEVIRISALKLDYALKQISKNGFRRSNYPDGDIKTTVLFKDSKSWRWLILGGNHRAAAVSALCYDEIPIRVNSVVRRDDVKFWPNVASGLYTENDALKVFDRFFDGITNG